MQDAQHEWMCEVYLPTLAERMTFSQPPTDDPSIPCHRSVLTRSLPVIMTDNFSVNPDLRIILKGRDEVYRIQNDCHEVEYILSLEQLHLIIAYEAAIRVANARGTPYPEEIPGGFVRLQRDYDREPLMRHNGFSVYQDDRWVSPPGDAPSYLDFAVPLRRNLDDGVKDKKTIYKLEQRIKGYEQDAMTRANAAERRDDAIATRRALKELGQSARPSYSGRARGNARGRSQRSLSPAASVMTACTYRDRWYDSPPRRLPSRSRSPAPGFPGPPTPDNMDVDVPPRVSPDPPVPAPTPEPTTTKVADSIPVPVPTTTGTPDDAPTAMKPTPAAVGTPKSLKALGRIPKKKTGANTAPAEETVKE
ncbi:hypothetical protein D9615_006280 [Tricholomella constricta]|uniref:Uncharacterized protein n=1 Tax=Tricholomella constricta TaxID=117010 RepID=A0A8H5M3Q0_9AGAR|nr:hypothetical protein D9615_006280 [Tricholomella constricta]